jgi:hypothetical protein
MGDSIGLQGSLAVLVRRRRQGREAGGGSGVKAFSNEINRDWNRVLCYRLFR